MSFSRPTHQPRSRTNDSRGSSSSRAHDAKDTKIKDAAAARNKVPKKVARDKKFSEVPSQRLNKHKQADPWAAKKNKTNFGYVYAKGGIPCRIVHGSIKHKLHWDRQPEDLDYFPLLITFAEGLAETEHPYVFVARQGFMDLLDAEGCAEKVCAVTPDLIKPLRVALMSKEADIFTATLKAIIKLSEVVGEALNPHLSLLCTQISKRMFKPEFQEIIMEVLQCLDANGGPDAVRIIKSKVPTYMA